MPTLDLQDPKGAKRGTVELDDGVFGIEPNVPVMHQVVTAQLAARRAGSHSTKTRAEVSGGGRKPFKQKGTGNARQGSNRAPHWKGGGVALGPRPRSYEQRTPKKMVRLALHSALSDRAAAGKVIVVDEWGWDRPKTRDAVTALAALGIEGRALVVVARSDLNVALSFRNLQHVHVLEVGELNAYDVLCSDVVVFTTATLPVAEPIGKTARRAAALDGDAATVEEAAPAPAATKAPAKKAAAKAPAPVEEDESTTDEPAAEAAAAAEAPAADEPAAAADEAPYGPGSHAPLEDDEQPEGFPIKGNADSMLFHLPGSRFYNQTKAEVWFATEADAEAAGFSLPASQQAEHDAAEQDEAEQDEEES
jgi:large subunit ribosomal protein L4